MAIEIRMRSWSATDPKQYAKSALQDLNDNYEFAMTQHPIRYQRLHIVSRMIEELLATLLAGRGYVISSVKRADGTNDYDVQSQDIIQEYQNPKNPFLPNLGREDVQVSLDTLRYLKNEDLAKARVTPETIREFRECYKIVYPALRAAVDSCQNMDNYGFKKTADVHKAGRAFAGTSLPGTA